MTNSYLVAYDIADDTRRNQAVRILLDYGERVQESVFWVDVDDELHERLVGRLNKAMDAEFDIFWIVPACRICRKSILTFGNTRLPKVPQFYVV